MPRSKDKVKRTKPCTEKVNLAVKLILDGRLSIRKAAVEYNLSKSLLARHVKRHKDSGEDQFSYETHNDVKRVFTNCEENYLVEYCIQVNDTYCGLPKKDFLNLVYKYAVTLKKKYPSSWDRDKAAGTTFYDYFMKRHPNLNGKILLRHKPFEIQIDI